MTNDKIMLPLPIDPLLPDIVEHLRRERCLVIEAPPGAGKTTRVPPALLDINNLGQIIVLEPRRLAARMAARRVAEEMGERLGETVGYQVRFDEVAGPRTKIRFVTEGILTRRLLSDPHLESVGAVILDEFHERHLQADVAIALLRRLLLSSRPDLRIVVMSATLDARPVAHFLGDCETIRSEGRIYPVEIDYLPRPDDRPLEIQIAAALRRLISDGLEGDALVFLPGAAEIRRAASACAGIAAQNDLLVLPLHGDLPPAEQDRAVRPSEKLKVILSTNVAESSVTIEGIAAVVDSGLARIAGHSPWSGLPMLKVERISRASAAQRAGRAGRTRKGRCLRLYTRQDFDARPEYETAEIRRADLAETILELRAAGVTDLKSFQWFESPSEAALEAAEALLFRLGAIDGAGAISSTGNRMLRFPVHPRQARLIVEAEARGAGEEGCILAALIGERDIRASMRGAGLISKDRVTDARSRVHASSDLLVLLDAFREAERLGFSTARMREAGLESGAVLAADRVRRQLARCLDARKRESFKGEIDDALLISALAGYPDRAARCRKTADGAVELLFAGGGSAQLAGSSVVRDSEFAVAVDAEQRQGQSASAGRSASTMVRTASAFKGEWIFDLFVDSIRETNEHEWNERLERVELVKRLLYDQLVIDESRAAADDEEASRILFEAALKAGLQRLGRSEEIDRFMARAEFVSKHFPEANFPAMDEDAFCSALKRLCRGRSGFAQLRESLKAGGLTVELQSAFTADQLRLLGKMAPERAQLAGRRQARIVYESGKQPWLASRLQDFFGMASGPSVAGGRVPVVLHLLAPNQRPVQVTTDLAGFWARAYKEVRRELSRRYPKHSWPEDPL